MKRSESGSAEHGLIDSAFHSIDPVPEMVRINAVQSSVALKKKKAGKQTIPPPKSFTFPRLSDKPGTIFTLSNSHILGKLNVFKY